MKMLDRKATQADCIRAINSLIDTQELFSKRLELLESSLNDLNNTMIEMLAQAGFEVERGELDS